MIFDRLFPKLTIQFFIDSLVRAGGYTPLKLQGVFGALAGQLAVAGFGGIVYAGFLSLRDRFGGPGTPSGGPVDRRGWALILPGLLVAWALFVGLLWPQLLTNYRGLPPGEATLITSVAMLVDFAVCAVGIMVFHRLLSPRPVPAPNVATDRTPEPGVPRRAFVALGLGAGLSVLLGATLRRLFQLGTFSYDGREYLGPTVQKITPIAPDDEFYQVSKNLMDPRVVRDSWRLEIGGNVKIPRTYTFADIAALPAVEQETTLLCISYRVGGGLCSNAVWKGVPLNALLAQAGPNGNAAAVLFHAADGYYETFPFAKAMEETTLLAYEMDGQPLPQRHGFPLRMIVPGLYGEKNPKWVTRIELLDEADARLHQRHGCGFYKEQGWGPNFNIPTTSRIDAPLVTGDHFEDAWKAGQSVELRGMAFGGDRGVSKVELSLDDGQTWREVPITKPGTRLSWSLWAYTFTPDSAGDDLRVVVRATDGTGALQIAENRNTIPQGATGLHRVSARVEKA